MKRLEQLLKEKEQEYSRAISLNHDFDANELYLEIKEIKKQIEELKNK